MSINNNAFYETSFHVVFYGLVKKIFWLLVKLFKIWNFIEVGFRCDSVQSYSPRKYHYLK